MMKRTGVLEIDLLQARAEAEAARSGKTAEQEFAALLKADPSAYQAYLAENPAQCNG